MTYLLPRRAADAWYDLSAAYEKTVGKKDVQPPYRALDSVLRAVHGDWVRWLLHGDGTIRIVARTQIDPEDLQDVLTFWAEAVLPGQTGEQLGQLLGDIAASTAPIPGPAPLPAIRGGQTEHWWAAELAAWNLAEQLAASPWTLDGQEITWRMDTLGVLNAWDHTIPGPPNRHGQCRYQMPRLAVSQGTSGHLSEPVLNISASATLLARSWYKVRTITHHLPGLPLLLAARTDGPRTAPRLNVPMVAVARRLAGKGDLPRPRDLRGLSVLPDDLETISLSALGSLRAIQPKNDSAPLGRGMGMEFYRQVEQQVAAVNPELAARQPRFLAVPKLPLPHVPGERVHKGLIQPEDIPITLDAAHIKKLKIVALWNTESVCARMRQALATQFGLPADALTDPNTTHRCADDRVEIVLRHDKHNILAHGTMTSTQRRELLHHHPELQPRPGWTVSVFGETQGPQTNAHTPHAQREELERQDGKHLSQRALATHGIGTQYLQHMAEKPPALGEQIGEETGDETIQAARPKAKPSAQAEAKRRAAWQKRKQHTALNAVRDLLRRHGLVDTRLSHAFAPIGLHDVWHIGLWLRRHATSSTANRPGNQQPAPVTLTFTAMRPANGTAGGPWQTWAWSPRSDRWQPYVQATTQLHADGLGIPMDEEQIAQAAHNALAAVRRQLPHQRPYIVYVDGDATERIWTGLRDLSLAGEQPPELNTPRWLPGGTLPSTQRPIGVVRVLPFSRRLARPVGTERWVLDKSTGQWAKQDNHTVRVLFQLQAPGPDHLRIASFALPNVPKNYAELKHRPGRDWTRWSTEAEDSLRKIFYAHTSTHFTAIALAPEEDPEWMGKAAAILTNQAAAWDYRQSHPTPLHLARKMDEDHPHHRRTVEQESAEEEDVDESH
ncbi:RNaseH domain-containing protein [Streptomyces sp. NBC_00853]|uniref:RNaseH domain-containing protein n=1 Tax=Streptomyces sp. NBC_00853 TaxID=2903681 RepID=UPI003872B3DC|nr:RNaseH domain-containing protein [Streptomyces sp. NBC_00853]